MSARSRDGAGEVHAVLVRAGQGRAHARWLDLSNEIGIDFPSISPSIDRVRDAFFRGDTTEGDDGNFELVVAPEEIGRGQEVVLDVPYSLTCGACGGRGESWDRWCDACGSCGDIDVRRSVRVALPRRLADGARFLLRPLDAELGLPDLLVRIRVAARR